jgi:hypothetical protein
MRQLAIDIDSISGTGTVVQLHYKPVLYFVAISDDSHLLDASQPDCRMRFVPAVVLLPFQMRNNNGCACTFTH